MPPKVNISGSFWILLGIQILTLPLNWVVSAFLAATFHELCHMLALHLFRIPVYALHINACGAQLDTATMEPKEEFLCALAGPLGSFTLLLGLRILPRVALCGLIQGLFNLIPLGSLDGGRMIRCAIRLLPRKRPCKRGKLRVQ